MSATAQRWKSHGQELLPLPAKHLVHVKLTFRCLPTAVYTEQSQILNSVKKTDGENGHIKKYEKRRILKNQKYM
jgi:hypothetical protein